MAGVAAIQFGYPVAMLVFMEAGDFAGDGHMKDFLIRDDVAYASPSKIIRISFRPLSRIASGGICRVAMIVAVKAK